MKHLFRYIKMTPGVSLPILPLSAAVMAGFGEIWLSGFLLGVLID